MGLLSQIGEIDPKTAYDEYTEYFSASSAYFTTTTESNHFYHSRQWPKDWADELLNRQQYPLVVGKVYSIIQGLAAMMTANNPAFTYQPQGLEDASFAELHKRVGRYEWQKSNGSMHYGKVVLDFLIGGKGVGYPYIDHFKKEARWMRVPPNYVVIDPSSEHPLGDDAASVWIRQPMTRRQAKVRMPLFVEAIEKAKTAVREQSSTVFVPPSYSLSNRGQTVLYTATGDPYRPGNLPSRGSEETIEVFDRFAPVAVRVCEVTDMRTGQLYYIDPDIIDDWMDRLTDPSRFNVDLVHQKYYRVTQMISNQLVTHDVLLPVDFLPIALFMNNHEDNPFPFGEVEHLKGLAMERNKRRSQIIYNMTTSGNNKWLLEDGSIDVNYWNAYQSLPGAKLFYREGYQKPEPVPPSPVPQAAEYLERISDVNMHEVAGHWTNNQGDPQNAPRTNMHQLTLDELSGRRLGLKLRTMATGLSRLGQTMLMYRQMYMTQERVIRILGEKGQEELVMSINSENPNNPLEKYNDLSSGNFDVVCEMDSLIPSSAKAKEERALELFDRGIYDDVAVLTSIADPMANDVLERKAIILQVSQQNQQLQQNNQELIGTVKNLSQQVEALMREIRVVKGTREIENRVAEARAMIDADVKINRAKGAIESLDQSRQVRSLRDKLKLDERERALNDSEESRAVGDLIKRSLTGLVPGQTSMEQ